MQKLARIAAFTALFAIALSAQIQIPATPAGRQFSAWLAAMNSGGLLITRAPGMTGDLKIYPNSGYVVAVLSNLDPPAAQQVSNFLDARLPG